MMIVGKKDWVATLKASGERKNQAVAELRSILMRGLNTSCRNRFSSKIQIDDVVQDALIKILDKLDLDQVKLDLNIA